MQRSNVTPEEFTKVWQQSTTKNEVVSTLGLSKSGVASRAAFYRKNGVELKRFSRGSQARIDFEALNQIALEHAPSGDETAVSTEKGEKKTKRSHSKKKN